MKDSERKFVAERSKRYTQALAAAMLFVRSDGRLVGADIIRGAMAERAALKAIGCPGIKPFEPPLSAGPVTPQHLEMLREIFAGAVDRARAALGVSPAAREALDNA